jgi:hypothetical protein
MDRYKGEYYFCLAVIGASQSPMDVSEFVSSLYRKLLVYVLPDIKHFWHFIYPSGIQGFFHLSELRSKWLPSIKVKNKYHSFKLLAG